MPLAKPGGGHIKSRLAQAVLRRIPAGLTLDHAILTWRPHPNEIGASPSCDVIQALSKQRNLYGATLLAATTDDPDSIRQHPNYTKVRVQRALALNQNLTLETAHQLTTHAITRKDPAMVLALLKRSPYFADLISGQPEMLTLLSQRNGQPGPDALARRVGDLEPFEVPTMARSIYEANNHRSWKRDSAAEIFSSAVHSYLNLVERDKVIARLELLLSMAETLLPQLRHGQSRTALPYYYTAQAEQLPGRSIITLTQAFTLSLQTDQTDLDLGRATHANLDEALAYPQHSGQPPVNIALERWPEILIAMIADWVAPQISEFGQLQTLDTLAPNWNDTLGKLVAVTLSL